MANQLYALTGYRKKPTYVDEINARTPYLRGLYQQKKDDAYRAEMTGLEKDRLGLEKDALTQSQNEFAANKAFAERSLASQEEQNKRSNALGVVGLAGNLYLGAKRNSALKDVYADDPTSNVGKSASGGVLGKPVAKSNESLGSDTVLDMTETSPGKFSWSKATSPSSYKSAVTSPSTWGSGIGGGLVGAEAGEAIGNALGVGGKAEQRVVGGALGGAATDYFVGGGDIYSNIFAGLLGGATGYASKDLWG